MRAVLKRTLVILGYAAGSILVLLLLAYIVLLVINRNDEAPSDLVLQFEAAAAGKAALSDEGNAYLFMLGFDAPPDGDPRALGAQRYQRQQTSPEIRLPNDYNSSRPERSKEGAALAGGCSKPADCAAWLEDEEARAEWIASEGWVLDRYRSLLELPHYHERFPYGWNYPQPAWSFVIQAQRLLMAEAASGAPRSSGLTAAQALQRDAEFWRGALAEADALLTKTIVGSILKNHFRYGNLALRKLPREQASAAIPPAWRKPLTLDERSMRRALIGEWRLFRISTERTLDDWAEITGEPPGLVERIGAAAFDHLYQRQATSNQHAQLSMEIAAMLEAPFAEIPRAVAEAARLQHEAQDRRFKAFNPIGNISANLSAGLQPMRKYAGQIADLEGIRRMALLAAEFRAAGVDPADVEKMLGEAELNNPYTNEPFEWDADVGAIIFRGLESTRLGYHAVVY